MEVWMHRKAMESSPETLASEKSAYQEASKKRYLKERIFQYFKAPLTSFIALILGVIRLLAHLKWSDKFSDEPPDTWLSSIWQLNEQYFAYQPSAIFSRYSQIFHHAGYNF